MRSTIPEQAPCPGRCNRALRANPLSSREPVMGEPVWCEHCAVEIHAAIGALPDLAAGLWAIGHDEGPSVVRKVVARDVDEICQFGVEQPVVIHVREILECGHRTPTVTVRRRDEVPPPAESRLCWLCAVDSPGADGRLAPRPESVRKGPRMLGSPAGSASYLAVDEVIHWAVQTTDYLKARLPERGSATPSALSADDAYRAKVLSQCCTFLQEWIWQLLATPHARRVGHEALDLRRRAAQAAGIAPAQDQPLPAVPCPACDRMSLKRLGHNPDHITCRHCGGWFTDRDVDPSLETRKTRGSLEG